MRKVSCAVATDGTTEGGQQAGIWIGSAFAALLSGTRRPPPVHFLFRRDFAGLFSRLPQVADTSGTSRRFNELMKGAER